MKNKGAIILIGTSLAFYGAVKGGMWVASEKGRDKLDTICFSVFTNLSINHDRQFKEKQIENYKNKK